MDIKVRLHLKESTVDCTLQAEVLEAFINEQYDADKMMTYTLLDGSRDIVKVSDIEAYQITDDRIKVKDMVQG